MKIKNIPLSISISISLLSWNAFAQTDNLQNNHNQAPGINNSDHNWMPQQPVDNYWQAPNWSDFHTQVRPVQKSQDISSDQASNNQTMGNTNATVTAPALQVPTMNEKAFVTESATADSDSAAAAENVTNQAANIQNQSPQGMRSDNMPAMNIPPQMPGFNNNYRPPMPQGYYIPPYQQNPYQRPFARPMMPPMQYGYRPYPPANMYQGYRPPRNMNQPNMHRPNSNQSTQSSPAPVPNYVPPAYTSPYYNGYNNRFNNNNWGNNFWGQSGPGTWTNPNKQNMEQGWDDMINAPSRMGTMPGGWNAPEITMPNPIDLGDQFQDNIQDLPEQLRNMDVGN